MEKRRLSHLQYRRRWSLFLHYKYGLVESDTTSDTSESSESSDDSEGAADVIEPSPKRRRRQPVCGAKVDSAPRS